MYSGSHSSFLASGDSGAFSLLVILELLRDVIQADSILKGEAKEALVKLLCLGLVFLVLLLVLRLRLRLRLRLSHRLMLWSRYQVYFSLGKMFRKMWV